ncbi:MAG: N-acetylmuramoyl-L-alanine amidase [Schwartzia sp.]|nr:N-acetylmuramoyl-L-alanine amidase [Schwartzia sp. (in: firmicutes)]
MKKWMMAVLLLLFFSTSVYAKEAPWIVDMPIEQTETRTLLIQEYAETHYGRTETTIVPQAVVVHWTAADNWESTYNYFYAPERADGTLNVASHFLVDRDGTVYRLTEETLLNRHAIGYNWCAIGIENVGGVDGEEDLTPEQLTANIRLISYLHEKYPTIRYVFGHYQQDEARESGLYIEHVEGYRSEKSDPGPAFMRGLRENLSKEGLAFFAE